MREVLEISRDTEYFAEDGLRTSTGLDEYRWNFAVFKELLDNALDAMDELREKRIDIKLNDNILYVFDNGPGIKENVLDRVFDFGKYVSSKRFIKSATRGFQGNALKTVIGISYLRDYDLSFYSDGKGISYKLNPAKIQAGIVQFEKKVKQVDFSKSAVSVKGINLNLDEIRESLWTYYLANPDVTFTLNEEVFKAVTGPVRWTDKSFIQWYDLKAFNALLQAVHQKDPNRTVRDFIQTFSGVQRIKLNFPHKRLSDFSKDQEAVNELYNGLGGRLKKPRPEILKGGISGKETLLKIYGESEQCKYKVVCNQYELNEATIPFVIEGFLLYSKEQDSRTRVLTSVNNSIPYEGIPFYFGYSYESSTKFCKKTCYTDSLKSLLDESGFTGESQGLILFLNFISPHIEFTDKAKTQIISHKFKKELVGLVEYLCKDAIKEIERSRRARKRFDRISAMCSVKRDSKTELMDRYFMEGFRIASGGFSVVVRQIFYAVRNIINIKHGIELNQSDYNNVFTQKIATEYMEKYPELEDKILFERRGYFYNPFDEEDLPLGTQDVIKFMDKFVQNKIYQNTQTIYSIPDELKYNHVLFIEKAGFNTILKESGLLSRLNLGVMSTAGFGTRAVKRLIKYFNEKGIKVYILTDCDIAGYLIRDKFEEGSQTFREPLNICKIGLTLKDVEGLGKRGYAEEVQYKRKYNRSLRGLLTPQEYKFLVIDEQRNSFRRVELNTLTSPELLSFIKSKIRYEPIKPGVKELESYIEVDEKEIIKNALMKTFGDNIKVDIDRNKLANSIHRRINGTGHWTDTMETVVDEYIEKKTNILSAELKNRFR